MVKLIRVIEVLFFVPFTYIHTSQSTVKKCLLYSCDFKIRDFFFLQEEMKFRDSQSTNIIMKISDTNSVAAFGRRLSFASEKEIKMPIENREWGYAEVMLMQRGLYYGAWTPPPTFLLASVLCLSRFLFPSPPLILLVLPGTRVPDPALSRL